MSRSAPLNFRRLSPKDERKDFRSGHTQLDTFFQTYAGQNQFRKQLGITWVLVEASAIVAYITVAPCSIQLPQALRRGLPRYPLPALRLARLAVDERARGRGLGRQLMVEVGRLALGFANDWGSVGLLVDAKVDAIGFYQKLGLVAIGDLDGDSQPWFASNKQLRRVIDDMASHLEATAAPSQDP